MRQKVLRVGDRARVIGQALPVGRVAEISESEPRVARVLMNYGHGLVIPRAERLDHFEPAEEQLVLALP